MGKGGYFRGAVEEGLVGVKGFQMKPRVRMLRTWGKVR